MKPHLPSTQLIAERAHQIWLEKGRQQGRDLEDWLQAEAEFAQQPVPVKTHDSKEHKLSVTARPSSKAKR
jgi:Protein of unknown function (DUF2934)